MGRVIVVGSLNLDLITRVERHPKPGETLFGDGFERAPGGKGGNQALSAARAGAEVAMIGAVGDDEAGRDYRARLSNAGVDTSELAEVSGPSGHALISVSQSGENAIIVIPGANAAVTESQVESAFTRLDVGERDVVLTVLEIPLPSVEAAIRDGHRRGAQVVVNLAPYQSVSAEVLAVADPVVVNEHEAELLRADGSEPASLLVTLGGAGARWGALEHPGVAVDVVDTTGAGDATCGALAAALARGATREEALDAAMRAGAEAVGWSGAQP